MATTPFNYGFGGDGIGGGPLQVPNRYIFNDEAARDNYFSSKLGDLQKGETVIITGSKVQMWSGDSNPSSYVRTRWSTVNVALKGSKGDKGDKGSDGAGIDASALNENEIPVWDVTKQTFVPSGVKATDGEVTVSPDSIIFGGHKMSSSVENVVFENTDTSKHYVPVWQEYDATALNRPVFREHQPLEEAVRVPQGTVEVINPTNTGVVVDADETFFGGRIWLKDPVQNLELEITNTSGELEWRDKFTSLTAGMNELSFDTPVDVKKGYTYNIKASSPDGDVTLLSNSSTGFSWTAARAKWVTKEIAKLEEINTAITDAEINGTTLTLTHFDGAKHSLTLPTSGTGVSNPKAVTSVSKSSGSFVFTHADGTTTTLPDTSGATVPTVQALTQRVSVVESKATSLESEVTALKSKDTALEGRVGALEGGSGTPARSIPTFYGLFGTTYPTTLTGAARSAGKRITISKTGVAPGRAFIIIPADHGSSVTGIKQGDGIPALWSSADKTIDGKQYKVFYSPRSMNESTATFTVEFTGGNLYV